MITEHLSTLAALLYFFFVNLAETSFDTAIGSPYDERTSIILYTLNAVPYIPFPSLPIIFRTGILYTIPIILTNIPAIASMEPCRIKLRLFLDDIVTILLSDLKVC